MKTVGVIAASALWGTAGLADEKPVETCDEAITLEQLELLPVSCKRAPTRCFHWCQTHPWHCVLDYAAVDVLVFCSVFFAALAFVLKR